MTCNTEAFLKALGPTICIKMSKYDLSVASSDVFSVSPHSPLATLSPKSIDQVREIWRAASAHGVPIVNRGGGLSYTGGVLPGTPDMAVIDTRDLNTVHASNIIDQYVTVEAGATWEAVDTELAGTGWRVALTPPISGGTSTVGGALAQGLPTGLEAVIGVDVVTPGGELHAIGPHHLGACQIGAHRMMGADLLGIFLGTCGAFGTIVRAHLRLMPVPKAVAFRSYAVRDISEAAKLIEALGPVTNSVRFIGLPVRRETDLARLPMSEQISMGLKAIAASKGIADTLGRSILLLKTALKGAPKTPDDKRATVHAIIEGDSTNVATRHAYRMDGIAEQHDALSVSAATPAIMQSKPYSLRGMLGADGERWVPVHGIGALSQLGDFSRIVAAFFEEHKSVFQDYQITPSWMMMAWPGKCSLVEPMFLWPAPLLPVHQMLEKIAAQVDDTWTEEAKARTEIVLQLKTDLTERLDEAGASHVQIGKSYPYQDRLSDTVRETLTTIKKKLDPEGLAAPGNLGFGP